MLSNPRDLFLHTLSEALWIERTLVFELLPTLQREAKSERLAGALGAHLEQTRGHVERVEWAFRAVGAEPAGARSPALAGLQQEHDAVAPKIPESRLQDVFLAALAMRVEHLELALYSSLVPLVEGLGAAGDQLERVRLEEEGALAEVESVAADLTAVVR